MEYEKMYQETGETEKKGLGAFWIVLFVLIGILITLLTVFMFLGLKTSLQVDTDLHDGFSAPYSEKDDSESKRKQAEATPDPEQSLQQDTDTATKQEETFTPSEMPQLDGTAPILDGYDDSIFYNNPIPDIYNAVSDSVVAVLNYRTETVNTKELLTVYGSGTGFIVSTDGYLLTNAHVVDQAEKVAVRLVSGEEYDAQVIGADNETDVAVLKIEAENLKAIAVGNSDDIRVGEFVIAIGNPIDEERLANTTTLGIISATARELTIDSYTNTYIQTDAAINFGNSGGPLLNMKGEVIGMNSAKTVNAGYDSYGNSLSAEGLGFALPINSVVSIMEHLITVGNIQRPAVGITVADMTELLAAQLNVPYMEGVLVYSVVKNGPADLAGIKAGDIIVEANGVAIKERDYLIDMIGECEIGDSIMIKVYREGEYVDCEVLLSLKEDMDFDDIVE